MPNGHETEEERKLRLWREQRERERGEREAETQEWERKLQLWREQRGVTGQQIGEPAQRTGRLPPFERAERGGRRVTATEAFSPPGVLETVRRTGQLAGSIPEFFAPQLVREGSFLSRFLPTQVEPQVQEAVSQTIRGEMHPYRLFEIAGGRQFERPLWQQVVMGLADPFAIVPAGRLTQVGRQALPSAFRNFVRAAAGPSSRAVTPETALAPVARRAAEPSLEPLAPLLRRPAGPAIPLRAPQAEMVPVPRPDPSLDVILPLLRRAESRGIPLPPALRHAGPVRTALTPVQLRTQRIGELQEAIRGAQRQADQMPPGPGRQRIQDAISAVKQDIEDLRSQGFAAERGARPVPGEGLTVRPAAGEVAPQLPSATRAERAASLERRNLLRRPSLVEPEPPLRTTPLEGERIPQLPGATAASRAAARERAQVLRGIGPQRRVQTEVAGRPVTVSASPRPRRPGTAIGAASDAPPPGRSDVALADDMNIPTHEKPARTPFRRAEGAANLAGLELEEFSHNAERLQRGLAFDEATMRPLFEALHGERSVAELEPRFQTIYAAAREMLAKEEEEMLAFFQVARAQGLDKFIAFDVENMAKRFMAHKDYFPRGWKQPEGPQRLARGRIGGTPAPLKPRVDATFGELLDFGYEPTSWNPLEMVAHRRMAGVNFREQVKVVNNLKIRGLVEPANMAPDDWRVPKVGPVFEGRPLPEGGTTRQLFTPEGVAMRLEGLYGDPLRFLVREKNVLPAVRRWTNRFKRLKLGGSIFQHIDFATRLLGPQFAPSSIIRGVPLKSPSLAARLLKVSISEDARTALRRDLLSKEPLFKDFPITPRMLIEEGVGVHGDISLIQREGAAAVEEAIRTRGLVGKPREAAQKISRFFESSLFRGVYRESQRFSLENFIIPSIRRQHPDWTPRQVAASAAEIANVQFSTLGRWQTVLQSPHLRELFYNLVFSFNESESLLRQALGTVRGPNKRLWVEHYLGMFFGLGVIANLINLWATGKPLPAGSYSPVSINDPYGPFKFGYNGRFLSPQAPYLKSTDGGPVYIDLIGQMDTALRWATDPLSAGSARVNVVPRAVRNQVEGESFMRERLDTPALRVTQLVSDLGLPIPAQHGVAALRAAFPQTLEDVVPRGEKRLGPESFAVQATGVNLRSGNLLDIYPDVEQYFDLETDQERRRWRKRHPVGEAVLFIMGRFTSLSSSAARSAALRIMRDRGTDPKYVPGYEKEFGRRVGVR